MRIGSSDWAALSGHFDRLADCTPAERERELARLDLDERHRRLLDHLLDQHDQADALGLDRPAPDRLGLEDDPQEAPQSPDWIGQQIGPWQVDEVIGRGGMSVIYRGHRADGRFDKQVAVKVLNRANLITDSARLNEETRILARLEHPGIARLIDGGTSEAGHGYLVMELVRGRPLDQWCRENRASTARRVALVIEAARALEYAHARQIVHCDVKPANLLVREDGRLCVVDFGIAALLQRQADAGRHIYCSPAYTAPERLRGAPPDTSQDVYSLGALLEELVVEPADRDLSAVCGKATEPDPEGRYGSMTTLRGELEAWQQKRPVAARGGGRTYILGRWLRRHSMAAILGLLLVVSLALGVAAALWQAREARSEAARAVAARDFLIGIFEAADPALMRGEDPPASELLRRGADRVRASMAGQPQLLAELLHVIGRTQLERGLIADAARSLDEVLAMEATRDKPDLHAEALSDRGLAAYEEGRFQAAAGYLERARALALDAGTSGVRLDRLEVRLADMLLIDGRPREALATVEPVLARLRDVEDGPAAAIVSDAKRVQGAALQETGQLERAQRVLEEALALQSRLDEDDILLAKIQNDLGIVYWYQDDLASAARVFERSLTHKRDVYGEAHPQTLSTLSNLAGVNMARGDHDGAEKAWRQSLETLERIHQGPHPDIAYNWGMLAWSHYMRGDFIGALDLVERGLAHRAGLADAKLPLVAWLPPLRGLLRVELDQPGALEDLQQIDRDCAVLDEMSPLQQRICLARRLLETDPPGRCDPEQVPTASESTLHRLPARWQAVHRLLEGRCSERAGQATPVEGADLPRWLHRRLPADT